MDPAKREEQNASLRVENMDEETHEYHRVRQRVENLTEYGHEERKKRQCGSVAGAVTAGASKGSQ